MTAKTFRLSLTTFSTSADHHALGWHLMRLKGMEDLAAFSAREVKRVAAEREKETSIVLQKNSESQSNKQSHPSELSEN